MARVAEAMLLALLLVLAGVVLAAPGIATEHRAGAMSAIVAVLVGLSRLGRRR